MQNNENLWLMINIKYSILEEQAKDLQNKNQDKKIKKKLRWKIKNYFVYYYYCCCLLNINIMLENLFSSIFIIIFAVMDKFFLIIYGLF